jgi:hypothetical protein
MYVRGLLYFSRKVGLRIVVKKFKLKRAVDACGDHPVFIVTPWPRFARTPCCSDVGHVTNFNNADFLSTILGDLNKHKTALSSSRGRATTRRRRLLSSIVAGHSILCIRASMYTLRLRSVCWRRWPPRTWTAARADSATQTTGRGHGAPATKAAAAAIVASPETDSTAPAA